MTSSQFNLLYDVGTEVILTDDFGKEHRTKTRSPAWDLGDGTPVVSVEGRTGGYALERIRPVREARIA